MADLDKLEETNATGRCPHAFRFKVEHNVVYVRPPKGPVHPRRRDFVGFRKLHPLKNIQTIADMEGVNLEYLEGFICTGDQPPAGPGFALIWNTQYPRGEEYSGLHLRRTGIPMPLMEFSTPLDTWDEHLKEIFEWRKNFTWETRVPKAVFRGGRRMCHPIQGDELAREVDYLVPCLRIGLRTVAEKFPNDLDVVVGGGYMSMQDQEAFKMILLVEGNGGWTNRFATQLAMQNVVLRQFNDPYEEWYSAYAEPYVHYVPVDHLFNYLPGVMKWCNENDDKLQQISKNADEYAKAFLPVKSQLALIKAIMEQYQRRFQRPTAEEQEGAELIRLDSIEKISYALMEKDYIQSRWAKDDVPT